MKHVNSMHRVEVVSVVLEPHPNADSLSIVRVYGYNVCVRARDWTAGGLGAYIPPDSLVDTTRPEFAFLAREGRTLERIRAVRLRGTMSQGLLIAAPDGSRIGDDVADCLGVTHYEPPVPMTMGGENRPPPPGYHPVYDLESWYRYKHLIVDREEVSITEKLHGCNARFLWVDGQFFVGSHRNWKQQDKKNLWWQAVEQNPWVEGWCRAHPGLTVYAEVYGQVQDLKYGHGRGEYSIAVFDVLQAGRWLERDDSGVYVDDANAHAYARTAEYNLSLVPEIYRGPYSENKMQTLINGPSMIPNANHLREGVVIKPVMERTCPEIGRMALKAVSAEYHAR